MVRPQLRPASQPADVDRAAVHDRGDVLAQGRVHRPAAPGCRAHRHPAVDLLRRDVPGVVLHGQEARSGLLENGDLVVHGGLEQLRTGDRGGGGGIWNQLGSGFRGGHRSAGRGSGDDRAGERRVLSSSAATSVQPSK